MLSRIIRSSLLLSAFFVVILKADAADKRIPVPAQKQVSRGERIYQGKEGIKAKIAGHGEWLSPSASRCVNCHSGQRASAAAPALTRSWLTEKRPRRGGPAFSYDLSSFCKTLQVGIDPEYVMLNRTMPRFDINLQQCAALWAYLTEEKHNEKK